MHFARQPRVAVQPATCAKRSPTRTPERPRSVRRSPRPRAEPLEGRTLFAVFTVDTLQDVVQSDGKLSLREAIARAASGDTVNFAPALTAGGPATIALNGTQLTVNKSLTISGPGAARLAVSGGGDSRVFRVTSGNVTIGGLTITGGGGGSVGLGGGVLNEATLTLRATRVTGNAADFGGGVANYADAGTARLTLVDSTVSDNVAASGGGGVLAVAVIGTSNVSLTNTTVSGNTAETQPGGGLFSLAAFAEATATLSLTNSTVSGNEAPTGGGIANHADDGEARLTVTASTVSGNTAFDGDGGGIANVAYDDGALAAVAVTRSTLSGNEANFGGGLVNYATFDGAAATATLVNSTLSGNAAEFGGGADSYGYAGTARLSLTACTVAFNDAGSDEGGGISFGQGEDGASTLLLRGTIVARNGGTELFTFDTAVDPNSAYNLIGDGTGGLSTAPSRHNLLGTLADPINPLLGPLASNGGATQTHALLPGSPAINTGGDFGLTTDQRGQPRPRSTAADVGAFERAPGGAVSGVVFDDRNGNGLRDGSEVPAAGFVVYLDQDNDGVREDDEPQVRTGADGAFIFRGLNAGTQRLRIAPRGGFRVTQPASGGLRTINLAANQNLGGQNFGVQRTAAASPVVAAAAPGGGTSTSGLDDYLVDRKRQRDDIWPFALS